MRNKKILFLSLLTAMAVLLNSFDIALTAPVPFIKAGLAHIITVTALYVYGRKEASIIIIFKILMVSLLWGRLGTPVFFISAAGNGAVLLFLWTANRRFSVTAFSVGAAFFNNLGQIAAVRFLFIPGNEMRYLYGLILAGGIISGLLIGIASTLLIRRLKDGFGI